jgi:hypothetical protein
MDDLHPPGDVLEEVYTIMSIEGRSAQVVTAAGGAVELPLASLPRSMQVGDRVLMHVEGGVVSVEVEPNH